MSGLALETTGSVGWLLKGWGSTLAAGKTISSSCWLGDLLVCVCPRVCLCARQCELGASRLATGWTRGLSPAGGGIHTPYVYVLPMNGPSSQSERETG